MLNSIRQYAIENNIPIMRDSTVNALTNKIKELMPARILEIGAAVGYSGIIMLRSYDKAALTTIEIDEQRALKAKRNFKAAGLIDRAQVLIGDAVEIVPCIAEKYDFVLLDGPKGQYCAMLPYLINMLNRGGEIFADNALYFGKTMDMSYNGHKHRTIVRNMRKFIDALYADGRMHTRLIKTDDGIIIAKKL
ncbi:MAG: O-methyltransferase [Christensenellales bacterium]|jgi:predicted O-methyltransferase YrrM